MPAAKYDFNVDRGSSFKAFLEYQTAGTTGIDLEGYSANMQVRRYIDDAELLLSFSGTTGERGVTGGGSTGEYSIGNTFEGLSGTGGIYLNASSAGATGGTTGGIHLFADATTMSNLPKGQHFYDLELTDSSGIVTRVLEGRFRVSPDVTR